jgi:hypothetical protein
MAAGERAGQPAVLPEMGMEILGGYVNTEIYSKVSSSVQGRQIVGILRNVSVSAD